MFLYNKVFDGCTLCCVQMWDPCDLPIMHGTGTARGAAIAGNLPAGEAERALRRIEWNFTDLTRIVPMVEIEDLPPSMQTHIVGVPRTWVRLFRNLGRAVHDYNRAHRP
jgi:hypothetical protein